MMITNQLLYQLSYKGSLNCDEINSLKFNNYQSKINIELIRLLTMQIAYIAICRPFVTHKSYSNRTRNPVMCGIVKIILFVTKQKNKRNDDDTKKQKTEIYQNNN